MNSIAIPEDMFEDTRSEIRSDIRDGTRTKGHASDSKAHPSATARAGDPITAQSTVDSPLGPVLLARGATGLRGLWFHDQRYHPGPIDAPVRPQDELLQEAARQLRAYFAGRLQRFDLPLTPRGTEFQQRVWRALREIHCGSTCSYGQIAQWVESPSAVRAVGAAIGRNPLSIVVPCHRVLGRDGALTGYAGGLQRKQALLALEKAL